MENKEESQQSNWAAHILPPAAGGALGAGVARFAAFNPKALEHRQAIAGKIRNVAKHGGTEAGALAEVEEIIGKNERLAQPVKDLFAHYAEHAQHKADAENARELSAQAQACAPKAKQALMEKITDFEIAGAIQDAVAQPVNRARSQGELIDIAREAIGTSPVVKDGGSVHQAAQELFKLQDALRHNNITAASLGEAETQFTSLLQQIHQGKQDAVVGYLTSDGRTHEAKEALLSRTGLDEGLYQPVEDAYDKVVEIRRHIEPIERLKSNFTAALRREVGDKSPLLDRLAEEVEPFATNTSTRQGRWDGFKARFEEALLPDAQEFAKHADQQLFQKAEEVRLNELAADMSSKTSTLETVLEDALQTRGALGKGGAYGTVAAAALAGIGLGLGVRHLLGNSHAHREIERSAAGGGVQQRI